MATSVANLLEIQTSSAALFYRKLREVIALPLHEDAYEIFDGAVELYESYFGGAHKENVVVVLLAKLQTLAY